jgi:hypothetical protein
VGGREVTQGKARRITLNWSVSNEREEEPRYSVTARASIVGDEKTRLNPPDTYPLPRQINLWQLYSLREGTHVSHCGRVEVKYTERNSERCAVWTGKDLLKLATSSGVGSRIPYFFDLGVGLGPGLGSRPHRVIWKNITLWGLRLQHGYCAKGRDGRPGPVRLHVVSSTAFDDARARRCLPESYSEVITLKQSLF